MLKHALVIMALVATPIDDGEAASRNLQRSVGSVEADSLSSVTVFVQDGTVAAKFIGRGGLVPMVEVVNQAGDVLPRGSVKYSRSGHVLKFSVRAPDGGGRLTFRVTGRNLSAGSFKMLVQQRKERSRRRR